MGLIQGMMRLRRSLKKKQIFLNNVLIIMPTKYGPTAGKKVEKVMKEYKRGTLKSGRSGKKVTSRKQAIAIGLSEARKRGARVPKKKN
jgi:Family of unknown function (DUF6496)